MPVPCHPAPVENRRNILTPRMSNPGALMSDTLELLASATGRSVAGQRPRIRPPSRQMAGGRGAPRHGRAGQTASPKLKENCERSLEC